MSNNDLPRGEDSPIKEVPKTRADYKAEKEEVDKYKPKKGNIQRTGTETVKNVEVDGDKDILENSDALKSGRRYFEDQIDFGCQEYFDQEFSLRLRLRDICSYFDENAEYGDTEIVLNLTAKTPTVLPVVEITGFWQKAIHIEGDTKEEEGAYELSRSFSKALTEQFSIGASVSAAVSAAPLGVGGSLSVAASIEFTRSVTNSQSQSSAINKTIKVNKGQGGQGWIRGGTVAVIVPTFHLNRDPELAQSVTDPIIPIQRNEDGKPVRPAKTMREVFIREFDVTLQKIADAGKFNRETIQVFPLVANQPHNTYYRLDNPDGLIRAFGGVLDPRTGEVVSPNNDKPPKPPAGPPQDPEKPADDQPRGHPSGPPPGTPVEE